VEKNHQHWKFGYASGRSDRNFDFAFPSLVAGRQIATISGTLLINAPATRISKVLLNGVSMDVWSPQATNCRGVVPA
jgi:hypothetical protein